MFVLSDIEPANGELLEFEIDLALDDETPLVLVRGEGRVIRAERSLDQPAGFAVQNVWFRLCEADQGQAIPLTLKTRWDGKKLITSTWVNAGGTQLEIILNFSLDDKGNLVTEHTVPSFGNGMASGTMISKYKKAP